MNNVPRLNERGYIRDGVVDAEAVTPTFDGHCLVKVLRASGVDGDEGDGAGVDTHIGVPVRGTRSCLVQLRREIRGHLELVGDRAEIKRRCVKLHVGQFWQKLGE